MGTVTSSTQDGGDAGCWPHSSPRPSTRPRIPGKAARAALWNPLSYPLKTIHPHCKGQ